MRSDLTVRKVFQAVGLTPHGPVRWLDRVEESRPGVYHVALVPGPDDPCPPVDVAYLADEIRIRWNNHPLVHVGRTIRSLSRRISEFYRHVHGAPRPHLGGQDVKLLQCSLWIYWCPTKRWAEAEDEMIEYFRTKVCRIPFANRVRSARVNGDAHLSRHPRQPL